MSQSLSLTQIDLSNSVIHCNQVLRQWQKEIAAQYARRPVSLSVRLQQLSSYLRHCPTGCRAVDRFLSGGIRGGDITQITGTEGCGKSQFCYSIAADEILKGNRVLFIDTEATFCAERVTTILRHKAGRQACLKSYMNLMDVVQVLQLHELFDLLHKLADETVTTIKPCKYSILILDSVRAIVTPHLTELALRGEEDEQFYVFKELIRSLNVMRHTNPSLVILVTNNKLEWFKKMWKNACSVTILLKKKPVVSSANAPSSSGSSAPDWVLAEQTADGAVVAAEGRAVVRQLEIIRWNELTVHSDPRFEVVITDSGFSDYSPAAGGDTSRPEEQSGRGMRGTRAGNE